MSARIEAERVGQRVGQVRLECEQSAVCAGGEGGEEGEGAGLGGDEDVMLCEGGVGGGECVAVQVLRGCRAGDGGETFVGRRGARKQGGGRRVRPEGEGTEGEEQQAGMGPRIWRRAVSVENAEWQCTDPSYSAARTATNAEHRLHRRRRCTAGFRREENRRR